MACTDARPNAPGDASPPSAAAGVCRPAAARALIGRSAPDDAAILRRTGSATVQRLSPGQPMTRDFRRERVRVVIDPSGKVVAAICG